MGCLIILLPGERGEFDVVAGVIVVVEDIEVVVVLMVVEEVIAIFVCNCRSRC